MVHLYSAFIQGALHRLCITFTHSHTHSHTDGGGNHARYNQHIGSNYGFSVFLLKDTSTLTLGEPGFELATLRLPSSPLYPLSHRRPVAYSGAHFISAPFLKWYP